VIEGRVHKMRQPSATGYAAVNGLKLYWESYGTGGTPLVVVHGGFGLTTMFDHLLDQLAESRRVVALELQGHGHTRDIDRSFRYEAFGDDIAGAVEQLGLEQADLLGYSLGAGACLGAAIQHHDLVHRPVVVSFPHRRDAWFPEVLTGFDHLSSATFSQMQQSPMYEAWSKVAPDPDAFPRLMDKTGDLQRRSYDWSDAIKTLTAPTLLVFADADSISISAAAEFFGLLGGGLHDGGWDGSARPEARLAVLPGRTHYDILHSHHLAAVGNEFLA
jgi:pimeloyl-ACP methyl ester carboxylesterase